MLFEKDSCLLDCAKISFGNMIKLENYEEQLLPILKSFREENVFENSVRDSKSLTVLISAYGKASLLDINNIIEYIREQLDEELTFSVEFKEVEEICNYINFTLISI